jgi:hypothetical protein
MQNIYYSYNNLHTYISNEEEILRNENSSTSHINITCLPLAEILSDICKNIGLAQEIRITPHNTYIIHYESIIHHDKNTYDIISDKKLIKLILSKWNSIPDSFWKRLKFVFNQT